MARDYKNRASNSRKPKKEPVAGWVWFLGGLLVGLLVCGLAWLKLAPQGVASIKPAAVAKSQSKPAKKPKAEKAEQAPKPRFDFYTILPEMEVVVPDPEPVAVAPPTAANGTKAKPTEATATASADYMLQMGSFRKLSDADRLKASMALVGLEAEIQRVTINGGDTFHRVRSGPYTRKQVNSLRARLKENRINSLVIKLKK